jgi:hypothetical protein
MSANPWTLNAEPGTETRNLKPQTPNQVVGAALDGDATALEGTPPARNLKSKPPTRNLKIKAQSEI